MKHHGAIVLAIMLDLTCADFASAQAPVASPNLYMATNFCPKGLKPTKQKFTDFFGPIFQRQSEIRDTENAGGLSSCADSFASRNRGRYLGEIFRSNSVTSCEANSIAADGRLMTIKQNAQLFSLLGTNWGGDGRETFALPDLKLRFQSPGSIFCITVEGAYPPPP